MREEDFRTDAALRTKLSSQQSSDSEDGAGRFRGYVSGEQGGDLREGVARMDGFVPPAERPVQHSGSLLLGRERSPWTGGPDGGVIGPARGGGLVDRLRFPEAVPPGGYAWWYLDAFSGDGRYGLTVIAFIGSVFSPYYFRARKTGLNAAAENHCALNVALYGGGAKRWTMTERGAGDLRRDEAHMLIGSSLLEADASKLTFKVEERQPLLGGRVTGSIVVKPETITDFTGVLDEAARHLWRPVSPRVHVQVDFEKPSLSWSGAGYLDMNWGSEPLEAGFSEWHWSRAALRHETAIVYEFERRDGTPLSLCLHIGADGKVEERALPQSCNLSRTPVWRMARRTRSDAGGSARPLKTFEDTPFYSRSMIAAQVFGEQAVGMHESLSLDRFKTQAVQTMLPYRMPRRANGE